MKTLKICLVILCLLPIQAGGSPQFSGANFFMKQIILKSQKYGNQICYYNDLDHDVLSNYKWSLSKGRNTFYCRTNAPHPIRGTQGFGMHQLLMGFPKCVDHKDRNGLNNTRDNLRSTSVQNNNRNATKQRNNTTGYRGVDYNKNHKSFRARVNINRKSVYCRYFKTAEEAAKAYNEAAIKYFGEFANLNVL
jgi:hypothetical protein